MDFYTHMCVCAQVYHGYKRRKNAETVQVRLKHGQLHHVLKGYTLA